jgi:AcrR family transcriptional regulator
MVTITSNPTRDSEAMRARILAAVGALIMRDGLAGVGINALARAACCDKVLIYRYFGDLDGVYAAYAAQGDFWWTVDDLTEGLDPLRTPLAAALKTMLRRHAEALRARPITLAVLAAELTNRTALVVALETVRERRALQASAWIGARYQLPAGLDFEAVVMLIGVAINYLAVRARTLDVMSGVRIASDADWQRVFAAIDAIVDALAPGG